MNEIQRLIQEMCPDGVPMVALGETISNLRTGLNPRVHFKLNTTDAYGYYITVRELKGFTIEPDEKTDRINEQARLRINERSKLQKDDILFSGTGTIGRTALVTEEPKDWNIKEGVYAITPRKETIYPRFLLYILHSSFIKEQIEGKAAGAAVRSVPMAEFKQFQVPLPPLPIQQRIVEILDKFTSLVSSLDSEIALRQKQYEYYRDKFYGESLEEIQKNEENGDYKIMPISDLGTITRGKRFTREDVVESGVPALHYGDMYTYYGLSADKANTHLTPEKASKMRFCKKGDVVIVGAGENDWDIGVGVVWLNEEKAAVHDACYILEHEQNPMYISHFLRSNVYHLQLRKYVSDAKICSFSGKDLGRILIPIPSLEKQRTIVESLDTFESLLTNLKKERALRQKQYEYYREKLLTFA